MKKIINEFTLPLFLITLILLAHLIKEKNDSPIIEFFNQKDE